MSVLHLIWVKPPYQQIKNTTWHSFRREWWRPHVPWFPQGPSRLSVCLHVSSTPMLLCIAAYHLFEHWWPAPSAAPLSAGRLPPICWSQVGPILALVKKMWAGERGIASGQKLSDVGSGSPRPLPWPQFLHTGSQMKAVAGHWWTCSVSVKWTLMISRWYLGVVCDWL